MYLLSFNKIPFSCAQKDKYITLILDVSPAPGRLLCSVKSPGLTCRAWVKCGPSANKVRVYICTVREKKHASRTLPFMTFCP